MTMTFLSSGEEQASTTDR